MFLISWSRLQQVLNTSSFQTHSAPPPSGVEPWKRHWSSWPRLCLLRSVPPVGLGACTLSGGSRTRGTAGRRAAPKRWWGSALCRSVAATEWADKTHGSRPLSLEVPSHARDPEWGGRAPPRESGECGPGQRPRLRREGTGRKEIKGEEGKQTFAYKYNRHFVLTSFSYLSHVFLESNPCICVMMRQNLDMRDVLSKKL